MIYSENRFLSPIKAGTGFFGIMRAENQARPGRSFHLPDRSVESNQRLVTASWQAFAAVRAEHLRR
jgi:hypothetical protein